MIPFFLFPCGNCCTDPCTIGTDTFDTDLSQFATTGSPSVSAGSLLMSSGDRVIFTPEPANDSVGWRLVLQPQTADSTARLRVLGCWTDANNHIYGDLSIAAGAARILAGQLSGGSDSDLTPEETVEDEDAELNARSRVVLCFDPGETIPSVAGTFGSFAGDGTGTSWTAPDSVTSPSGTFAEFTASPMGTTNSLTAFNFNGPLLPSGTVIDGIAVNLRISHDGMDVDYIDSLVQLIDHTGTAVGDNKATATSLSNIETNVGWGDSTDDWNAGITPIDINSPVFGVVFQFQNVGSSVGNINVRGAEITIWFTTPERTPGRLTFSYENTAAPNTVQCVRSFDVFTDGGLKTGIQVISGDWTFTEYDLKKLYDASTAPTCPECAECNDDGDVDGCDCCDTDFPAAQEYLIDLGAGGWTNVGAEACDECTTVSGVYAVTYRHQVEGACIWLYQELISCTGSAADCEPDEYRIAISLSMGLAINGGCRWEASVSLVSLSEPGVCFRRAYYDSDVVADGEQCQTVPVTLTKFQPPLNVAIEDGDACGGLMPDTITLDLP